MYTVIRRPENLQNLINLGQSVCDQNLKAIGNMARLALIPVLFGMVEYPDMHALRVQEKIVTSVFNSNIFSIGLAY